MVNTIIIHVYQAGRLSHRKHIIYLKQVAVEESGLVAVVLFQSLHHYPQWEATVELFWFHTQNEFQIIFPP